MMTDEQILELWKPYREFPVDWIVGFARALLSASKPAAPAQSGEPVACTDAQIEVITYDEYAKRQGHESDFDCILKVVKRCLGVTSKPRNVDGATRAEFEAHLRVCFQHDNVRARERGRDAPLNGLTADQEREIAERVELNYPTVAQCSGCTAFDSNASEVHFVQGCEGCTARMQKIAGFGPLYAVPQPAQTAPSAVVLDDERAAQAAEYAEYLARSACDNGDSWEFVKPMLDAILAAIDTRAASPQVKATQPASGVDHAD